METQNCRDVWVFAEQRDGKLLEVGLELLGLGRRIADKLRGELAAVLFGHDVEHLVDEVVVCGSDKVYLADSPALGVYRSDAYSMVMGGLIKEYKPEVLLIGATSIGVDLAATVAARVETGLSAHCTEFDVNEKGQLVAIVPAFGGVWASIICPEHRPQMATVSPGIMKMPDKRIGHKAPTIRANVEINEEKVRTKVVEVLSKEQQPSSLENAETVVVGGYGMGSKENWKMVEELAAVLGGSVGATRPACDEGWASLEEQMIGQSGRTVHPALYIGIGVSGFMHHLVGIKDSKVVVAINNDPNAPITKASDYVIIDDFRNIVPALIEECKKALE